MRSDEIFNKLTYIESEYDLLNKKIQSIYFWTRIRLQVFSKLIHKFCFDHSNAGGQDRNIKYRTLVGSGLRGLATWNPRNYSDALVLFNTSKPYRRKRGPDDTYWDQITDPLCNELDLTTVNLENRYDIVTNSVEPIHTTNTLYSDTIRLLTRGISKLGLRNFSVDPPEREFLSEVEQAFLDEFDIEINIVSLVEREVEKRRVQLPIYRKYLDVSRPDSVIISHYASKFPLIEAAKERDIPTIEFQHGATSLSTCEYHYPNLSRSGEEFPDYMFVYGEFWKRTAQYPMENVRAVGFPYLEHYQNRMELQDKENQILFISERAGGYISRIAAEFSEISELDVVYKLHPNEFNDWREKYPWLIDADVEVIQDSNYPIYTLQAQSKYQVGIVSTALFEGLKFGVKNILLDSGNLAEMEEFIDATNPKIADSAKEIKSAIKNYDGGIDEKIMNDIFRPNGVKNVEKELKSIH